jgi:y4mF family transcriptional regulator
MTILSNGLGKMDKILTVKTLGALVRAERKQQQLTQENLAAGSGVGIRYIRELEQGKETCHIGKALHVVKMLGIDLIAMKRGQRLNWNKE